MSVSLSEGKRLKGELMERIQNYISRLQKAIDSLELEDIRKVIELIMEAYQNGQQIFVFGNGGSASTASHIACDLGKNTIIEGKPRMRIMSLTDNVSAITAWANDTSYDNIFVEQLKSLLNPNDLVIGISASGNSENVLRAIEYSNSVAGCKTVGLTGFGGGKLAKMVDASVVVNSNEYGPVEDIHLIFDHIIQDWIYRELKD